MTSVPTLAHAPGWLVTKATARGTCGELVQGFNSEGLAFHVTLPIARSTSVEIETRPARKLSITQRGERLEKIEWAAVLATMMLELGPVEVQVERRSELAIGKGMGSSTADIVAVVNGIANAYGRSVTSAQVARIATSIESSDGTMYPGSVAFAQRTGELLARYEWFPAFNIVTVTPATSLETSSVDFAGKTELGKTFDEILDLLGRASSAQDHLAFAAAATESARLNQRYVPNAYFRQAMQMAESVGALGVAIAHTGTMLGMLFAPGVDGALAAEDAARVMSIRFPDTQVSLTSSV